VVIGKDVNTTFLLDIEFGKEYYVRLTADGKMVLMPEEQGKKEIEKIIR
jgi:uncharacterized protein YxeA